FERGEIDGSTDGTVDQRLQRELRRRRQSRHSDPSALLDAACFEAGPRTRPQRIEIRRSKRRGDAHQRVPCLLPALALSLELALALALASALACASESTPRSAARGGRNRAAAGNRRSTVRSS